MYHQAEGTQCWEALFLLRLTLVIFIIYYLLYHICICQQIPWKCQKHQHSDRIDISHLMHTCVWNIHCCFKKPLILHCCRWCVGCYGLFWLKPTCSYPHISSAGSKLQPRPPSGHWGVTVSQSVETHTNILLVLVILGHSTSVSLCPYERNMYSWIMVKTQSDSFANWTPDAGFQNKLNEGRMMSSHTNTHRFISSQIQLPSFLPLWASAVISQIHRLVEEDLDFMENTWVLKIHIELLSQSYLWTTKILEN